MTSRIVVMEPMDELKRRKSKPIRPKELVDVDDFPSVNTEDMFNNNGEVPISVFTTPHDDLSTLANDTIGRTVCSWDSPQVLAKRWISQHHRVHHDQRFQAPSHDESDFAFEVKEWPKLDSVADEHGTPPKLDDDAVFSLHKMPTDGSVSKDFQDIVFHEADGCEIDLRRRGHCVVLAILATIVSSLLIGVVLVFLLSGNDQVAQNPSSANEQENGGHGARPSPSPVIPTIPDGTTMTASPTLAPSIHPPVDHWSQKPWPIGTAAPTQTLPTAYPTQLLPPVVTQVPVQTQPPTQLPVSEYFTYMPTPAPTTPQRTPSLTSAPTIRPSLGSPTSATLTLSQENFIGILQVNASSEEYLEPLYHALATRDSSSFTSPPQWRALEWLTADPNYYTYRDERKLQRYALAVFAFGLESLPDNTTWLNYDIHECDWYTTSTSGSMCSGNTNKNNNPNRRRGQRQQQPQQQPGDLVQRLELDNLGLVGTLPVELGLLSNTLTQIYLRNNDLSGSLPSIWGKDLQRLMRFQLTNARLEGTLPSEWGQMSSLAVLGLGRNQLNGSLPEEWAMNGGMPSLGTLGLESNAITGTIPTVWGNGGMPSLIRLYLNKNLLTGPVPDSLWSPNAWLEVNLAGNDLTGVISDSTCTISTLATLVADCNSGYLICNCCTLCV